MLHKMQDPGCNLAQEIASSPPESNPMQEVLQLQKMYSV